ncbi:MAG: hypothetical protein CO133_01265, partial [Candidatus Komeilibacteria bacterium CG_4_9_14_3_um_filter_37_5]
MKNIDGILKEEKKDSETKISVHQYTKKPTVDEVSVETNLPTPKDKSQQEKTTATDSFLRHYPTEFISYPKNKQKKWRLFFLIF